MGRGYESPKGEVAKVGHGTAREKGTETEERGEARGTVASVEGAR